MLSRGRRLQNVRRLGRYSFLEEEARRRPSFPCVIRSRSALLHHSDQSRECTSKIPTPFGLLLAHKYCIGTQQPSGFDVALLEAAKTLPARDIYFPPVVVEISGLSADWYRAKDRRTSSKVYPLTSAHVSAIITGTREHIDQSGPKDEAYLMRRPRYNRAGVELVGSDTEWTATRDVKELPFYTLDYTTHTIRWKHERREEDYTGNESSGIREDSLCLSYAIMMLEQQRADAQSEQDASVSS
jgi:hypothetical protein